MNRKLDELKTTINYIKQVSEDLSKATDKLSTISNNFNKAIDDGKKEVKQTTGKASSNITKLKNKVSNLLS